MERQEAMTRDQIITRINARLQDGTGRAGVGYVCLYRTPGGLACAVGCLIPDEYYEPLAEYALISQVEVTADGWRARPEYVTPGVLNRVTKLALMLNKAGIPATDEIRQILIKAQMFHDTVSNWTGTKYVGAQL